MEIERQLTKIIEGEFAFLSSKGKESASERFLDYAKSKSTNDQTRPIFYKCYKQLVGFREAKKELNNLVLTKKLIDTTLAGPLKVKTIGKKYRKLQKMNKKFMKIEATGNTIPLGLQEVIAMEKDEFIKNEKIKREVALSDKKEDEKAIEKAKTTEKPKKRKEEKSITAPVAKKAKEEVKDIVMEVIEPIPEKKKKTKFKSKKAEEKRKVKFDLSANTTKSISCYDKSSIFPRC